VKGKLFSDKNLLIILLYKVIIDLLCCHDINQLLLLQRQYRNLGLDCSFWFKLFSCWISCMDGMTTGSVRMSSSGEHFYPYIMLLTSHSFETQGDPWLWFKRIFIFCTLHCRYMALLVVSLVCYVATFTFSGLLFHWFTPSGYDCGLNTFFIDLTLVLVFVFAVVALHPQVRYYCNPQIYRIILI